MRMVIVVLICNLCVPVASEGMASQLLLGPGLFLKCLVFREGGHSLPDQLWVGSRSVCLSVSSMSVFRIAVCSAVLMRATQAESSH